MRLGVQRRAYTYIVLFCLAVTNSSWIFAEDWIYTTRPGDNLWDLSQEYLISMDYWRPLQEHNNITEPRQMPPGTRLHFPVAWLKAQPVGVRVLEVAGDVSVQSPQQPKRIKVVVDSLLHANDEIRTGKTGSVTLLFGDGSRLLLQANSLLRLDVIRMHEETGMVDSRMRLKNGRIESTVNPVKKPNIRFEIHTPGAVSAVRGTELRVMSNAASQVSSTEVLAGQVAVSGSGETQMVAAGFGTVVKAGEPPQAPMALLQAPSLAGIPLTMTVTPIQFDWPAVAGAESYRIQLAYDDQFNSLLLDYHSDTAEFSDADISDGEYALRVRAISAVEQFYWSQTGPRIHYRIQVDDSPDFDSPIVDVVDYLGSRLKLTQNPPIGQYYWRVAAAHQPGKYGAFSDTHAFEILHLPAAPQIDTPQIDTQQVKLRWQSEEQAPRYHYDLAIDPAFAELIANAEVAEPKVSLERPEPGRYYLRVRAIDKEGVASPYSDVKAFDIAGTTGE